MKVKDLKLIIDQFDDEASVNFLVSMGTTYRMSRCIIKDFPANSDLYPAKKGYKNKKGNLVLTIE